MPHKNLWMGAGRKEKKLFQMEYSRHQELAESKRCSMFEREYYRKTVSGEVSKVELTQALSVLSSMLHAHHEAAPILIIDEYDTPIQQGYMQDYYNEVIQFMRNLFSGGLKDNPHLSYGFLTGILRVAKESIFSGMNNLKENSILDERYSEYFGFTKPKAFWQSTGSNDIIREIVKEAAPEIKSSPSSVYSFLLVAGYLKVLNREDTHDGNAVCDVAIPNKEVFLVYEKEILA